MQNIKVKSCPFCGGGAEEHSSRDWRGKYKVIRHKLPCYLCHDEYPYNFTLIPIRNVKDVKLWNHRSKVKGR